MSSKWAHLGHTLGECWNDSDKSITFVNIPKNASSFIKGCLLSSGNFTHSDSLVTADHYLVALRDPIDRWISGIAQFMNDENNQSVTLHDLVDRVTIDDHTELQTYFLEGVDLDRCTFIQVDKNLRTNLSAWFKENDYIVNMDNIPNINQGNQLLKDRFAAMVDGNSQIKLKLVTHYEQDYALINRVKFYGN
jgi:hypothetical protein